MNYQAYGGMLSLPNFILYRLDWNAAKNKYDKHPCSLDGHDWPVSPAANRTNYNHAVQCLSTLPQSGEHCYALGFWLTEDCGYFLFDLDGVINDGVITDNARGMTNYFAGACIEYSSSGRGLHIIGRRGVLPDHRNRNTELNYEFYVRDRGIALGNNQTGNADHDCTPQLLGLLPTYFPPRERAENATVRRSDWRGPDDDDVLIERFLNARQSAAVLLGGKLGIRDLWAGNNIPEDQRTEADLALASHLAFWTGCDGERMERLMRRSGLRREKWDTHRTYLRELTIERACTGCTAVYQEPVRDTSALQRELGIQSLTVTTTPADMGDRVKQLLMEVSDCGTFDALTQDLIPRIASCNIPLIMAERLVQAVNKKLDIFDAKMPVQRLRNLLCPPVVRNASSDIVPEWVHQYCYVTKSDKFYSMTSGEELTAQGFHAANARLMPERPNGERENPAKWCLERWGMITVDDIMYNPAQPQYFEWAGTQYVNSFIPSSIPLLAPYTQETTDAINRFQQHLYLMCGKRNEVYSILLQWLAYTAQNPGRKIKWSPLIKGVPGDGKSIIGDVMSAALGERNVRITAPGTLDNTGGFTDWTVGSCFNLIEEVHMEGDTRHALFNSIKIYIDSYKIDINSKGRRNGRNQPNVTNHLMLSNYADAAPTDENDRRLMTIFSPYNNADECAVDRGLRNRDDLPAYFRFIGDSCRRDPGQWRAWLLSVDTSQFDASGRAPWTEERARMAATGSNPWDTFIADILEKGGLGIHKNAFSSSRLNAQAKLQAEFMGVDVPKSSAWSHTLVRLGYTQLPKVLWWNGTTNRVWCKSGFENSVIAILDSTLTGS